MEVEIAHMPAGVEATWLFPADLNDNLVVARVWGLSGGAYACPLHVISSSAYVGACGVFEAGGLAVSTIKATAPRNDTAWLAALGARARGGIVLLPPWTLGVDIGGSVFLVRPRLAYDTPSGTVTLDRAWPGFFDVQASLQMRLP
jgi:hypothetical protein